MASNKINLSQCRHILYGTMTNLVLMGTVLGLYIINSPQENPDKHQLSKIVDKNEASTSLALVSE